MNAQASLDERGAEMGKKLLTEELNQRGQGKKKPEGNV